VLAGLFWVRAGWTFLIAWIGQAVLFKVAGAVDDPRWGPCLAAAVLLGPPAFGLSGVLPAMLRLAVSDLEYLGRHTGRMIALVNRGKLSGNMGNGFFFPLMDRQSCLGGLVGGYPSGVGILVAPQRCQR
jgi:hypothetical protein